MYSSVVFKVPKIRGNLHGRITRARSEGECQGIVTCEAAAMSSRGWRAATLVLLGIYLLSGLQLLYQSNFGSSDTPRIPWKYSMLSLFGGVYCDNRCRYGSSFNGFVVLSCVCILLIEDYALKTGTIFGHYAFTDHLGYRVTPRLPLLVIVLWQALLFPAFSLSHFIVNNFLPSARSASTFYKLILQIVLASTIITGFDVISEPIAVLYGHQVWHHAAFINNNCDSYVPQPDWVYNTDASAHRVTIEQGEWHYYYYGIPLRNFFGWFLTSICIYTLFTLYIFYYKLKPTVEDAFAHISYLIAIVCTTSFYILHPCHPLLVKRNGCIYLICLCILLFSSIYYKKCKIVKSD